MVDLVGDGEDIGSEIGKLVGRRAARFAGGVVAALVGNDDAETCGGERLDLFVPGIPEFGEAMKEDDDGAVGGTGGDGMESDLAIAKG